MVPIEWTVRKKCNTFNLLKQEIDNYIGYYNNDRYQ
ncbi:IS3 family transposase [Clostridium gasigenes]|nr:integrase core domain-containing protein [Clostridium gasigenes]MBU3137696.1 integrase core domain-containing protein [Clostridium gasigenes]